MIPFANPLLAADPHGDRAVGDRVADFEAEAVYVVDDDRALGVRWTHVETGLSVVVLHIQSVPQVLLHVNTPPVSDRGEPHTGEHLLLGKGRRGKILASEEGMSFIESTAYTRQTDVVYAWNCAAGKETFFRSVESYLDALLLPDYSDEEIRREVWHLGVVTDEASGARALAEKGTIYQEMTSTFERRWVAWFEAQRRMWGDDHPMGRSAGGDPEAIRTMEPEHIHRFHASHYHLSGNLGLIVALPESVPEVELLERMSTVVARLEATPELAARPKLVHLMPPPRPSTSRELEIVEYPNANPGDVGMVLLGWPAVERPALEEQLLVGLLLDTLAEGDTATLYPRLMDPATREAELEASSLFSSLDESPVGIGPMIGLDGVPGGSIEAGRIETVVDVVGRELARVAGLELSSPELEAFNRIALVKLTEREKGVREALGSPPLFGRRGGSSFWLDHLRRVDQQDGDRRSLTLAPVLDRLRSRLEAGENPWTSLIASLGLDGPPAVTASRPSPEELARRLEARRTRLDQALAGLRAPDDPEDDATVIDRFATAYDAATAELEASLADLPRPSLVPDVPLTLDPSIELEPIRVAGVDGHRAVFDTMTFGQATVSLRLEGVAPEEYPWLALLPDLLTSAGVIDGEGRVSYAEAQLRRSREILGLDARLVSNPIRGRHELRIGAAGLGPDEASRAVRWIELALTTPWLELDNLDRIRGLASEASQAIGVTLGGPEESWVRRPARAIRHQDDPLVLASESPHTRLLSLARIEWWLGEPPTEAERTGLEAQIGSVLDLEGGQEVLVAELRRRAGEDRALGQVLGRLADLLGESGPELARTDLARLGRLAVSDLSVPPEEALADLRRVLAGLLHRGDTRFVVTGNRTTVEAMVEALGALFEGFEAHARPVRIPAARRVVDESIAARQVLDRRPVHYGLVNPRGTAGVHVHTVAGPDLDALDADSLVDLLAGRVYAGGGPHSFFMQTWGAGLAYSNGLRGNVFTGDRGYYAERCPDLVETMKFVIGVLGRFDEIAEPYLAEYALAASLGSGRASDRFEERAEAAADDLADGVTDARVARFRQVLLGLDLGALWPRIQARVPGVTGELLPGADPSSTTEAGGVFLVIAPSEMLDRWAGWLRSREGASLHRIYGRDFWLWPEE